MRGVEVCHHAKVPVSIKQHSGYPYISQTDIADRQLSKIAADTALTKTMPSGKIPPWLERLNDFDNPGEDRRRDEQVQYTTEMKAWHARAHKVHVKEALQDVEEDDQQERTHSVSY